MEVKKKNQNIFKYIIGFGVCVLIRLIPFRPPNVEPVTGTMLPFSKKWGWLSGALFGALSMILFDFITGKVGTWTWVTAGMMGLVGAASGLYLNKKESKIRYYVGVSIIATLIYDFVTGPIMSSLIWKMPFMLALIGQLPFTLYHLIGNITFAITLSPLLYKWVIANKQLEVESIKEKIKESQIVYYFTKEHPQIKTQALEIK
jgi:uncharacterized membrane protein